MREENSNSVPRSIPDRVDAVILGGGLSGLLLARQLRQEVPDLSVAVLERMRRPLPDACHKVGESSVSLGSQYLEKLKLTEYLLEEQIVKMGLRFFPGGGHLPLHERTEIGPSAEPVVRSYQLDRGKFEGDLRAFAEEDGVHLVEGAKVTEADLIEEKGSEADHSVSYELDGETRSMNARWVVDATGRNALMRRKLKLTRGVQHKANAGWFRVRGDIDMNEMVPRSEVEWFERPLGAERWRSTNHFMGVGYWAWIIPLSTDFTSIGLVVHEHVHGHECISSYEKMMDFLREHEPQLAAFLEPHEPQDYLCLRNYSNSVGRAWSPNRWAMVGEAGAFVDPLYSPGTDFIALANSFTTQVILEDRKGGCLDTKADNPAIAAPVIGKDVGAGTEFEVLPAVAAENIGHRARCHRITKPGDGVEAVIGCRIGAEAAQDGNIERWSDIAVTRGSIDTEQHPVG